MRPWLWGFPAVTAVPDVTRVLWRTGRKNGHTIYAQLGENPSDSDPFLGSLLTPEAAAEAVRAHNAFLGLRHLGCQRTHACVAGTRR